MAFKRRLDKLRRETVSYLLSLQTGSEILQGFYRVVRFPQTPLDCLRLMELTNKYAGSIPVKSASFCRVMVTQQTINLSNVK